jgi:hypothetical protein
MAIRHLVPDYDDGADVLYLMIEGAIGESECEETSEGVTLRYASDSGEPIGAIVVGYEQYLWPEKIRSLAEIVGAHLSLPAKEVEGVLSHVRGN